MGKKSIFFIMLLPALIFIISFACAFGYSSSYTTDSPLNVYPGEVKDAQITLRTTPDEGNLTIKAEMLDNASIAELADGNSEYEIGPEKDAIVSIKLKIPAYTPAGQEYQVRIRFADITLSEKGGTVGLRGGIIVSLNPKVIEKNGLPAEKPTEEKISTGWIILGVIIIAAIIVVIYFIIKIGKKPLDIKNEEI